MDIQFVSSTKTCDAGACFGHHARTASAPSAWYAVTAFLWRQPICGPAPAGLAPPFMLFFFLFAGSTAHISWLSSAVTVSGPGRTWNPTTKTLSLCIGDEAHFMWKDALTPLNVATATSAAKWVACNPKGAKVVIPGATTSFETIVFDVQATKFYFASNPKKCAAGQKIRVLVKTCAKR